jgi:molecular chaperone GrpE
MTEKKNPKRSDKSGDKGKTKPKTTKISNQQRLQAKIKKAEAEIGQLKDRLLRSAAELKNVRMRTEREIAQIIQKANENLIRDLLPVLDDFERSLKTSEQREGQEEFLKGFELIHQKLLSVLAGYGLESMETTGAVFDVELHHALMQVEEKGTPPDQIVDVHEKGYLLKGQVLRHAKVVVSK